MLPPVVRGSIAMTTCYSSLRIACVVRAYSYATFLERQPYASTTQYAYIGSNCALVGRDRANMNCMISPVSVCHVEPPGSSVFEFMTGLGTLR